MHTQAKSLFIVLVTCALAACATPPTSVRGPEDSASSNGPGYFAGILTLDCHESSEHPPGQDCPPISESIQLFLTSDDSFRIRRVQAAGIIGGVKGIVPMVADEYDEERRELRYHFCLASAPVRVRLATINYFDDQGTGRRRSGGSLGIDLVFNVHPNSVALIGEIKFVSKTVDWRDGRTLVAPDAIELRPHSRANLAVLDKCPEEARTLRLVEVPLRPLDTEPEKQSHDLPDWMVPDQS